MASVAGTLGGFGQASYAATKAALIGLGKSMALEGARYGITANVIAPGIIGTEAWKMGDAKMNDRMVLRTAMRSAGRARGHRQRDRVPLLARSALHHRPGAHRGRRHRPLRLLNR